jgi:hypothetical protein
MANLERRPPDFEIRQILQCLKTNGYEFEDIEDNVRHYGTMNAIFTKDTPFSESDGNYVNDSSIKVKIQFDSRMDYTNQESYEDEEGDYVPNIDQGDRFISSIFSEMAGGKGRKTKRNKSKNKKSRKNRKNRRK